MGSNLYSLVYVSQCDELHELDIIKIIKQSTEGNARLGVTGVLVHKPGSFLQMIEGEMSALQSLYRSIRRDKRHHAVKTVRYERVAERLFPSCFMAYRDARNIDKNSEYSRFFDESFCFTHFIDKPGDAMNFLAAFRAEAFSDVHFSDEVEKVKVTDETPKADELQSEQTVSSSVRTRDPANPLEDVETVKAIAQLIHQQSRKAL